MTRLLFATAVLVGLLYTAAADDTKKAGALDGTWELASGEIGGQKLPEAVTKKFTLILEGAKYTVTTGGPVDTGTVKFDTTKKPKELDVRGEDGPNKGKTFPAIYVLDGDTLTVCYDMDGKRRPAEFKSAAGTKQFLAVYKRQK